MTSIRIEGAATPRLHDRQIEIVVKVDAAVGILAAADIEGIVAVPALLLTPGAAQVSHHCIDCTDEVETGTVHPPLVDALYIVGVGVVVENVVNYLFIRGYLQLILWFYGKAYHQEAIFGTIV